MVYEFYSSRDAGSVYAQFQTEANVMAQTLDTYLRDHQAHVERHAKLAAENAWTKVLVNVREHKSWFDGNSLRQSAIDKPVDPWFVETRMPTFNSSAMTSPPPTVQNTERAEEVTRPIPKTRSSFDMANVDAETCNVEETQRAVQELSLIHI